MWRLDVNVLKEKNFHEFLALKFLWYLTPVYSFWVLTIYTIDIFFQVRSGIIKINKKLHLNLK